MYSKRKRKAQRIRAYPYLPDAKKHPDDPSIRGGWWRNRRLCSQYVHEEQNWMYSNYSDYAEREECFQQMWREYYAGCL